MFFVTSLCFGRYAFFEAHSPLRSAARETTLRVVCTCTHVHMSAHLRCAPTTFGGSASLPKLNLGELFVNCQINNFQPFGLAHTREHVRAQHDVQCASACTQSHDVCVCGQSKGFAPEIFLSKGGMHFFENRRKFTKMIHEKL